MQSYLTVCLNYYAIVVQLLSFFKWQSFSFNDPTTRRGTMIQSNWNFGSSRDIEIVEDTFFSITDHLFEEFIEKIFNFLSIVQTNRLKHRYVV